MSKIYLFCKSQCSACDQLKKFLTRRRIDYTAIDGTLAGGATFMRVNGIFLAYYPAMCVSGRIYEYSDLFSEKGELLVNHVLEILVAV